MEVLVGMYELRDEHKFRIVEVLSFLGLFSWISEVLKYLEYSASRPGACCEMLILLAN
jgi:hypothetical protein